MATYNNDISDNLRPICILEVLKKHSDVNHKLTQKDIIDYLKKDYGIKLERKSVGRILERLKVELDQNIEQDSHGSWMEPREFEDVELRMLIDAVFTSRYIPKNYSADLINKICGLSSEYFKPHIKYTYTVDDLDKTENKSVFLNIELVGNAIEAERQIEFDYNKYKADKKLHYSSHHIMTPYRMIVHNQRYYLMGYHEYFKNIVYYRLDHMTNMKVLDDKVATSIRTVPGWKGGITNKNMATNMPYMFSDKHERITLYVNTDLIDQMVDWLGYDIEVLDESDPKRIKILIKTSPQAIKYFALQYINDVEILEPLALRKEIREILKESLKKYKY